MQRITSALFLDFDNIFGGLLELDREAALALAQHPGELVDQLGNYGLADGNHRDLLVRRAYLNPAGAVQDKELGNDSGRLYLTRFRPHLVRAGFEVIDCPALTMRQKNAGDIRIVIDVLTALEAPVRYDEIIIASSDADFTPLLLKLRAEDRRTTIITAGFVAPAYQAVADRYIDEQQLIALLLSEADVADDAAGYAATDGGIPVIDGSSGESAAGRSVSPELAEAQARAEFDRLMAAASEPLNLASTASALHRVVGGDVIRETKWFGKNGFVEFVQDCDPTLQITSHVCWDPSRHDAPPEKTARVEPGPALPPFIAELHSATDLPRLPSASWAAVFETLAEYAHTHTFALTEATAWTRDVLAERGHEVARRVLGFVIRGCLFVSVRLDADPPPDATALRAAFVTATVERARSAGLEPTDDDLELLDAWLSGRGEVVAAQPAAG